MSNIWTDDKKQIEVQITDQDIENIQSFDDVEIWKGPDNIPFWIHFNGIDVDLMPKK